MRSATEVVTRHALRFHPFDRFPLQEVAGAVGGFLADTGAVFIEAFFAEIHTVGSGNDLAVIVGEKKLSATALGERAPEGAVILVTPDG